MFLFSDTQIKDESFLEDINNILNSGDVPNIYANDELDKIYNEMKPECAAAGLQPTKSNMFRYIFSDVFLLQKNKLTTN